jgi:hypothetical protein
MKRIFYILSAVALLLVSAGEGVLFAQQIVFDRGVRAGELTVFPEVSNNNNYFYLLDKASVAETNGKPEFSFIRYVRNTATTGSARTVSDSDDAGGIVHVLVNLSIPEDMRREAERELKRINPSAKLVGPIIYKSGTVALISSIAGEDGNLTRKVVGIGNAPLLDGQKAALSIHLTKQGADILWATFQTSTPDLSFAFDMDARGFLSPKRVKIEADFEQVYSHRSMEMAVRTPVLAAEIKASFDELSNSGAIKVTQIGDDEDLNKLKETAYNQLVNLMFDKVGGQGVPDLAQLSGQGNQKSMLDRAGEMLDKARTEARTENKRLEDQAEKRQGHQRQMRRESRTAMDSFYRAHNIAYEMPPEPEDEDENSEPQTVPIPGFAVAASFQLKEVRRKGKYLIDLNKYTEDSRNFPFSENVGNMKERCGDCFYSVNLDDPLYKQREVHAQLVGINAADFDAYINNVEVVFRKKHQNSTESVQSLVINRGKFNEEGNDFSWNYGWKNDNNRAKWLAFDYKTKWTFNNGATVETDWVGQDFAAVNLTPPLIKREVYVELDPDFALAENIRGAEVSIVNKALPGPPQTFRVNLKTADNMLSRSVELFMEPGREDFEYEVALFIKGKQPMRIKSQTINFGSIYLDALPQE